MAALEVIALDEGTPQLRAPGAGDTYTMPRAVDHAEQSLTGVKNITLSGESAAYTAAQPASLLWSANHTIDFANASMPAAVFFGGTYTFLQGGNPFGMGGLFAAAPVLKNDPGVATNFGGFYGLILGTTFQADSKAITVYGQLDAVAGTTFDCVNSGSMTVGSWTAYAAMGNANTGVTVTTRLGFSAQNAGGGGTVTKQAGFASAMSSATSNTDFLIGTATPPSGNYGVYQDSARVNRWGGGQRWKYSTVSGASATLTAAANHMVFVSYTGGVCTITLPDATVCGGAEFFFKKTGSGGSVSVVSVSGQTFDGAASPLASIGTQWHTARIISDGANWLIVKSPGAP